MSRQPIEASAKDVSKAREEIYAIAQRAGLALQELLSSSVGKKRSKRRSAKNTGTVPVQFRNPVNVEQQWTGRGRQPKREKELLDAGKALEALEEIGGWIL